MRLAAVAWKNLFRRKIRSAATLAATALAVATMVTLVGLAEQLRSCFQGLLQERGVEVVVFPGAGHQRFSSVVDESLAGHLRTIPGVAVVAPGLVDMTSLDRTHLIGVPLSGWPTDSPLLDTLHLLDGRPLRPGDGRVVLIGKNLARQLAKAPGEELEIETRSFQVVGIFESSNVYENGMLVVPLGVLQKLIDRPGKVSGFALFLDSQGQAAEVCAAIRNLRDEQGRPLHLDAEPAQKFAANKSELRLAGAVAWMTSVIALALSSIGVLNTMMMAVFERTAELGILRAIGWSRWRIVWLVVSEAVLLNLVGAVLGCLLAVVLVQLLSRHPSVAGLIDGRISFAVVAQGLLLGLLTGSLGALYPGWRAASLDPTEAIRHA